MKKITLRLTLILSFVLLLASTAGAQGNVQTVTYPDVQLNTDSTQAGHFPEIWDLTACDMTIQFTYDGNGLVDDFGSSAHAWGKLGLRELGWGDVVPSGVGVWLATDYHDAANTFDPDPNQDLDDKLHLQKIAMQGEGDYNLPSPPPIPGDNHRFWFDRDGVNPFQAQHPLAVDGGTYNTGGVYDVAITLSATGATSGEAYMTVNGLQQGFEVDGNWQTMELAPAGMTFSGQMAYMQLFYSLVHIGGATHSVEFRDITVTGCQNDGSDFVTGGGWIRTDDNGRANFGLVARYNPGSHVPSGNIQYNARKAGIRFHSESIEWLTVSGEQATFKGLGQLNGENAPTGAPYVFRVWVKDGDPDTFQIRIWYESGGQIEVYN
ncbi:MAG: post-COAP-1 domain-containing protein, partial [Chloroflexota bacterium]